jgi:peptidase E
MRNKLYLLAGGPQGSDRVASQLAEALSGCGREHPAVAYIGTASGDNRAFMKWFRAPLERAGAGSVELAPLVGRRADAQKARKLLEACDAVFLSGGEVEDGMRGLDAETRALLGQMLADGKRFIGVSAGSIMLGKAWPHWEDEDHHPENATLFDCLGFAAPIFDTHAEAEGWPELQKAVELSGDGFVGYGIPSGEMAVLDESGALIPNQRLVRCENHGGRAILL